MKIVFVDTNILVDLIADRPPFSRFAIELFTLAEQKKVKLVTSSHAIATTHYLLKKYVDEIKLRTILINLLDFVQVIPIDHPIIIKSLKSKHKDFEDAIQILTAESIKRVDYIVTRNLKDFTKSVIPAIAPDDLLRTLLN